MSSTQPEWNGSLPEHGTAEQDTPPEVMEYETVSGMTVEISDIEVDVVDAEGGEVLSSQADPEAYGIEPSEDGT